MGRFVGRKMAHGIHKLAARTVESAQTPGLLADGGGLYLQVSKSASKSWLFRFMLNRRSREMGLGSLKAVSLASAREKAAHCRSLLADGVDPIEARKTEREATRLPQVKSITFEEAADAYIAAHEPGWKNAKHASQWRNTLRTYALPIAGSLSVSDFDTSIVMQILRPVWTSKPETASRLRGRIERILDWSSVSGFREGQNPAQWRGHLENLLPSKSRVHNVKHHPAMHYQEVGAFVHQIRDQDGMAAQALEFLIYTAARTSEVIGAEWDEINLDQGVWTIPDWRTKTGKEHRVPLADRPLKIIEGRHYGQRDRFVFPGGKLGKGLSNMAMLSVLRRSNIKQTVHGFRSSFRDWAADQTQFPREVIEQALAHTIGNKVEAAYLRSDLFEKRRHLMDLWASYLDAPSGNIIDFTNRRELA